MDGRGRAAARPRQGNAYLGASAAYWTGCAIGVAALAVLPATVSQYGLLSFTGFLIPVFLALSLSLLWGFGGILSLGQAAFYGLGAYSYGVVGINMASAALGSEAHGTTDVAVIAGLGVPALAALILGLTMLYARLKTIHIAILTLVVTLFIQAFLLQTAGPQWKIGIAYLGGDNGLGRFSANIHEPPSLRLGFGSVAHQFLGSDRGFFYIVLGLLVVVFVGLRWLVASSYGRVLTAIREDPQRTETFGYNVRRIQLQIFCLSAILAALSGILFVAWGNFISPDAFGVTANILPVIWVAVAGRTSLVGVVATTIFLGWLTHKLAIESNLSYVVLGGLLVVVATFTRDGVVPAVTGAWEALRGRRSHSPRPACQGASLRLAEATDASPTADERPMSETEAL